MIETLPPAAGSPIKSIQNVSITIATSSSSNTATISSVDTSKAQIAYGGVTGGGSTEIRSALVDLVLTNATTVTASRSGATTNSATAKGFVIEYY